MSESITLIRLANFLVLILSINNYLKHTIIRPSFFMICLSSTLRLHLISNPTCHDLHLPDCSTPTQATVTTPWLPQQIWRPRRNHVPPVSEYGMTSATSMTQLPFELVARKAKIFQRPKSAQPKPSNSSESDTVIYPSYLWSICLFVCLLFCPHA